MGKRRDSSLYDDDEASSSPHHHKKHKKHKHHKKHKRHRESLTSTGQSSDTGQSELVEGTDSLTGKPQLRLKIKIGGQTLGTKSFDRVSIAASSGDNHSEDEEDDGVLEEDTHNDMWRGTPPTALPQPTNAQSSSSKLTAEQAEEEAWLDALEAGELDEYGEIPKPKDESLLTARQKSLLKRAAAEEEDRSSSFFGSEGKLPEMTEEMIQKRAQKAQRRRVQERRKVEENKKQTIEKLLKKQDAKTKAAKLKQKRRLDIPHIRYTNSVSGISLSFPEGHSFPLGKSSPLSVKPVVQCGILGCFNAKRYSCSKTGVPLCSLACYKKIQTLLCAT